MQHNTQILIMFFPTSLVKKDINNKQNHEVIELGHEHMLHQV